MPNVSTLRGIEQKRADYAYKCALEAKNTQRTAQIETDPDYYKSEKYKSYAKSIPMLVKSNGLGATFAFILSKKAKEKDRVPSGQRSNPKNAYDLIYKQTAEWINNKYPFTDDFSDFSAFIITQNSNEYRAITNEVISFFTWLRRFAEGLIDGEDE